MSPGGRVLGRHGLRAAWPPGCVPSSSGQRRGGSGGHELLASSSSSSVVERPTPSSVPLSHSLPPSTSHDAPLDPAAGLQSTHLPARLSPFLPPRDHRRRLLPVARPSAKDWPHVTDDGLKAHPQGAPRPVPRPHPHHPHPPPRAQQG